jgi:PAS domain S-box-containing protein
MDELLATTERIGQQGSWLWNLDTDELRWSDNLFRIFGLEPQELAPSLELVFGMILPDDAQRFSDALEDWRRSGSGGEIDYRIVRADGKLRHVRATIADVSQGPRREMAGLLVDVTDQRRTETEVQAFLAMGEVLSGWTSLEADAPRLLAALAQALGLERGIFWVPADGLLRPRALWQAAGFERAELEEELEHLRLARGSGIAGRAWETLRPVVHSNISLQADYRFGRSVRRDGLQGAVAIPAVHGPGVSAVVGLAGRHLLEVTDRFQYTLSGIGAALGDFLVRHSAELHPPVLTGREQEILQLVADGLPGPAIAARLEIAPNTLKTHFHRIYAKLHAADRAGAVAEAMRRGIVR